MGSLAPKWLNIRRASFLGFLAGGWALCPWIILESAETFLNFMSAYSIFMAPMTAILLCDYYLIKRGRYDVPALYDPHGIYFYKVSPKDTLSTPADFCTGGKIEWLSNISFDLLSLAQTGGHLS